MLSEAVWNDACCWFFTSTAPITPACSNNASAPRLADQASVRGDSLAKNPEIRAEILSDIDGLRTGSPSIAVNSFWSWRARTAHRGFR